MKRSIKSIYYEDGEEVGHTESAVSSQSAFTAVQAIHQALVDQWIGGRRAEKDARIENGEYQ